MPPKRVRCPSCGWDGTTAGEHDGWFRHVEEVTVRRRVEGLNRAGVLEISSEEKIEVDDVRRRGRLCCGNCLTEFPVPRTVTIAFVDPY